MASAQPLLVFDETSACLFPLSQRGPRLRLNIPVSQSITGLFEQSCNSQNFLIEDIFGRLQLHIRPSEDGNPNTFNFDSYLIHC